MFTKYVIGGIMKIKGVNNMKIDVSIGTLPSLLLSVLVSDWIAAMVLFVALKLTGVIAWSWLWVLCPIWILPFIIACFLVLVGAFVVTCMFVALLLALIPGTKS